MIRTLALASAFAVLSWAAGPADLSGTWKLNLEKSDFGQQPAPKSIVVTVVHKEPSIKWTGEFVDAQGQSHPISVDGVIDGKPRPSNDPTAGKATLKRIDARTIESDWTSDDGKMTENATLTMSDDGRTVTRKVTITSPEGNGGGTEVYDKQ